jgi:hypothetical protein
MNRLHVLMKAGSQVMGMVIVSPFASALVNERLTEGSELVAQMGLSWPAMMRSIDGRPHALVAVSALSTLLQSYCPGAGSMVDHGNTQLIPPIRAALPDATNDAIVVVGSNAAAPVVYTYTFAPGLGAVPWAVGVEPGAGAGGDPGPLLTRYATAPAAAAAPSPNAARRVTVVSGRRSAGGGGGGGGMAEVTPHPLEYDPPLGRRERPTVAMQPTSPAGDAYVERRRRNGWGHARSSSIRAATRTEGNDRL